MSEQRQMETVFDPLTEDEIRKLGEELAQVERSKQAAREERKATVGEIAGRVNLADKRIAELTEMIVTGRKPVEVEVITAMNTPKPGWKRVIRVDRPHDSTVREEPMTWEERQGSFAFEEQPDERREPES